MNNASPLNVNHSPIPFSLDQYRANSPSPLFTQEHKIFDDDGTLRICGRAIDVQTANTTAERVLQLFQLSTEQLHGAHVVHGSNSASLLAFTDYGKREGSLSPIGKLMSSGTPPFGGKIGFGSLSGGFNEEHLSTTWIGDLPGALKFARPSPWTPKKSPQEPSQETEKRNSQMPIYEELDERKAQIEKAKQEAWEKKLTETEKSFVEHSFPVLYGITSDREGSYVPVRSFVRGEIGLKNGALPHEIKTIFVPPEKIEAVESLLRAHGHNLNPPFIEPFQFSNPNDA